MGGLGFRELQKFNLALLGVEAHFFGPPWIKFNISVIHQGSKAEQIHWSTIDSTWREMAQESSTRSKHQVN